MVFLMFGIGLKTKLSDLLDVGKVAITPDLATKDNWRLILGLEAKTKSVPA